MKPLAGLLSLVVPTAAGAASAASPAPSSSNTEAVTWQIQGSDPNALAVGGLPADISLVQTSNYGGLALDSNGGVWTWDTSSSPEASQVKGPNEITSVGEGANFGAGTNSSGNLWVWGNDSYGELCNGTTKSKGKAVKPTLLSNITGLTAVSGGGNHLMLLLNNGTVQTCGVNDAGQLGNGKNSNSDTPVKVAGLRDVESISAGQADSVALDTSGNVWIWGYNGLGQLGDGNTQNSNVPVEVDLPAPATQIYAGGDAFSNGSEIVLLQNGQVWAWGDDAKGELGNGQEEAYSDVPVQVQGLSGVTVTAVATAGVASFALDSSGNVWGWGGGMGTTPTIVAKDFTEISGVAGVFGGLQKRDHSS
jgi:alpha-tubulin suppressor-like RCC1 family protein